MTGQIPATSAEAPDGALLGAGFGDPGAGVMHSVGDVPYPFSSVSFSSWMSNSIFFGLHSISQFTPILIFPL